MELKIFFSHVEEIHYEILRKSSILEHVSDMELKIFFSHVEEIHYEIS